MHAQGDDGRASQKWYRPSDGPALQEADRAADVETVSQADTPLFSMEQCAWIASFRCARSVIARPGDPDSSVIAKLGSCLQVGHRHVAIIVQV